MAKTKTAARYSRGFISFCLLWAAVSTASLFLSSVKAYGLLAGELSEPNTVLAQTTGRIHSLPDLFTPADTNWALEIGSAWYYNLIFRDTVTLRRLVPMMDITADTAFMPAFSHYDDNGFSNSIFPVSAALSANIEFVKLGGLQVSADGGFGMEWIQDYNYYWNIIYFARLNGSYTLLDSLTAGLSFGLTDLQALEGEAALRLRLMEAGKTALYAQTAMEINGAYEKTLKGGLIWRLNSQWQFTGGTEYDFTYGGLRFGLGACLEQLKLWGQPSSLRCAVTWQGTAGFTLIANWVLTFSQAGPQPVITNLAPVSPAVKVRRTPAAKPQ